MNTERGLVMSVPMQIKNNVLRFTEGYHGGLDPQAIRSSLLFWDKLDFPINNMILFVDNADMVFLASSGVLSRTKVDLQGSFGSDVLKTVYTKAFRMLDQNEPGKWSLASLDNSEQFAENELEEGRGVLVQLHHGIAVPDREVPLQDILEFRERRRDELLSIRHNLNKIYLDVISSGDIPLALNSAINALQKAVSDHLKVVEESRLKFRWSSIGANLNIALSAALVVSQRFSIPVAVTSGIAVSLSVNLAKALKWRSIQPTPYRYISRYHEAFLRRGQR